MYIPPDFGAITPYFFVANAESFIEFLVLGFGGSESLRHLHPEGRIAHSQVKVNNSTVMVSEASEKYPPMTGSYYLYVENADESLRRAIEHGATLEMEVMDMPYGDRQGGVRDPYGNIWWISQRLVHEPYSV